MGIISRFSDVMKSNINAMLDKCEDPAKMVDQTLRDLREDLAKVKQETAGVMADAKEAERRVADCQKQIDRYTAAATNALKAGNEADARTLMNRWWVCRRPLILPRPMPTRCTRCTTNL